MWSSFVVCLESQNKNFIGDSLQGRIGPAAPPPLRAVGPWLNHVFFMNLLYLLDVVKHIWISTKTCYDM